MKDQNDLQRKSGNHTYETTIRLGNLQNHQLEALKVLVEILEDNGAYCDIFEVEND